MSKTGTKLDAVKKIEEVATRSHPGDLFVLFFAGHGSSQADADGGADQFMTSLPRC